MNASTPAARTKVELPELFIDEHGDLMVRSVTGAIPYWEYADEHDNREVAHRCKVHDKLVQALGFAHVLVRELTRSESIVITSALEEAGFPVAKAEGRAEASEAEATNV